jgi:hypothetical protein
MSLQIAAQHLSSQGRGNDSMLVHMSPREVNSLNAIAKAHGGQLTINPKTGLAEAGFLESILPMAAGFALNAAMPGSGMLVPALVGGGMALMTGSLEKGLMAGLGAYGGANLGASLAQQGVEQATAQQLAQDQGFQAVQAQAAGNAASLGQAPVNFANEAFMGPHMPAAYDPKVFATQAQNITEPIRQAQVAELASQADKYKDLTFMGKMKQDFGTLSSPGGASGLFDKVTSSPMSLLKTVGASSAPGVSEAMKPKAPEEEKPNTDMGQRYAFSPGYVNPMPGANPMGQEQTFMNSTYRPIGNEEAKKIYGYAEGGTSEADPAAPPVPTSYTAAEPTTPISTRASAFEVPEVDSLAELARAKESQRFIDAYLNRPAPIDVQEEYNDYLQRTLNAPSMGKAAGGSISDAAYNLGSYSDGGRLLRGPGDGVSDSIPAVIGKRQPARLADGEFVVPARIVSELGNGSTEAGARKLYAMMDRIQKARKKTVGKGKVAKNSRSEKYLPA